VANVLLVYLSWYYNNIEEPVKHIIGKIRSFDAENLTAEYNRDN
jgi:hypothetical protein